MFCKSGILIFIFAENNYSTYAHTMLIKTPLLHQSFGPRVLLSLSLSLSCSLTLSLSQASSLEHRGSLSSLSCPGFWDPLEKALCAFTPLRGRLRPPWTIKPRAGALLAFCVNQGISAFFFLLYFLIGWLRTTRFQSIKGPQQYIAYSSESHIVDAQ